MALVAEAVDRFFQPHHSDDTHLHAVPRSQPQQRSPSRSATPVSTSHRQPSPDAAHMSPESPARSAQGADKPAEHADSTPSAELPLRTIADTKPLKIQDLAHIQSVFATRDKASTHQYDISDMPIDSVIEMVAGVLTRITATNDVQHDHLHKQMPAGEASVSQQTSSVLAFHGKTVPSITILNYLNRIHKYCPTSYEVFVSLLVYFDRMTDRVNSTPLQTLQYASQALAGFEDDGSTTPMDGLDITREPAAAVQEATPPLTGESLSSPGSQPSKPTTPHVQAFDKTMTGPKAPSITLDAALPDVNLAHFFVVDSFNIHRLIIAGVTCASKFFSDIFYTNSRYAKVGGLPLPELNHLELQFLLLNDFRLSVPVPQLEAYSTMLVEFYGRQVTDQLEPAATVDVEMT